MPVFYVLAGILFSVPLIFDGIFFSLISWIITAPAMYLLLTRDAGAKKALRSAYKDGLLFFMGYGAAMFHWFIYLYPLEFTGISKAAAAAVVLVSWFGLPFLQSLVLAFMFVIFIWLRKFKFIEDNKIIQPFILASLWIIFEWTQTLTWAGVPWSKLAMSQLSIPQAVQGISLFGSYLISFLIILSGSFCAVAYIYLRKNKKTAAALCGGAVFFIFTANFICGSVLLGIYDSSYDESRESVKVAAIQGNIGSSDKWGSDKLSHILSALDELSREAANEGAELIIWSETAIPHNINTNISTINFVKKLAIETGAEYLIGTLTNDYDKWNETKSYNSVVYVEADGTAHYGIGEPYHKRHLVPFGEFLPLKPLIEFLIPPLAELTMLDDEIDKGIESRIHDTKSGKIGSLICFDSIYEELARKSVIDGAELIAISTNDSWFYDSTAVYQHNKQACLRAIETGRYVVRSGNTGISSIITPTGEITEMLPPLVAGYVIGDVQLRTQLTLYMRCGNIIVWGAIGFISIITAVSAIIEKKKKYLKKI